MGRCRVGSGGAGVSHEQRAPATQAKVARVRTAPSQRFQWLAALALSAASLAAPASAQDFKPNQTWRVIESAHFRVTFASGLDSLAARAAVAAESVRTALNRYLGPPPAGKIDLILSDDTDDTNGYANPFPSNRVALFAHPPADEVFLGDFHEWMTGLLAHELTHIWQLDRAGRAGRALRTGLGRLPFGWPLFPVIGVPNWFIEGSAVSFETELTGRGRLAGRVHEMMMRTAVLEGRGEPYDRISNPTSSWPASNRPYAFGSLFVDRLARVYRPDVRARMTTTCAGAVIPPPLAFDRIGKRTFGRSVSKAYRDWQTGLAVRYASLRDSVTAEGLTATEVLAEGGAWSGPARFSSDGRQLVFHRSDWRRPDMAVILDLGSRREKDLWRQDVSANFAWLPGGDLLTSQPEMRDTYCHYSDLRRIRPDGHARQLTHGARLEDPDLCPRTGEVVAVQNGRGTTALVLVGLAEEPVIRRLPSPPEETWAHPRWSPDGSRIAAERISTGNRDIVILDRDGVVREAITTDRACDAYPAWSPDGRFLVFASDRTGIWNLFAADMDDTVSAGVDSGSSAEKAADTAADSSTDNDSNRRGALARPHLQQMTNLLGGALQPDVSPDGKWVAFSSYHAEGMRIERIPFEPAQWRRWMATPASAAASAALAPVASSPSPAFVSRPYRAWRSMRPYYWMPYFLGGTETGDYYGLLSSGVDLTGVHSWSAWALMEPQTRRVQGASRYSWSGLGNPVLGLSATQRWDLVGASYRGGSWGYVRERERVVAASATVLRQRMHSSAAFSLGGELTEWRREPDGDHRDSLAVPLTLLHPHAQLVGISGAAAYSNTSWRFYSISPEDGVSMHAQLRRRWRRPAPSSPDGGDTETRLSFGAYRAVTRVGWSRAVAALGFSGVVADGPDASWADIGGVSQGTLNLDLVSLGGGRSFPLRGFRSGVRSGTRAWSAALEWRMPLFLVERGINFPPLFLERTWAVAFADAGDAWSRRSQGGAQSGCGGGPCIDGYRLHPLLSAGAELAVRGAVLHWVTIALRFGIARQLAGGTDTVAYVALGGGGIAGTSARPVSAPGAASLPAGSPDAR